MRSRTATVFIVLSLTCAGFAQTAPVATAAAFTIKNGDRVVFYGDSITEQREYTEDVEEFVLTRYPAWSVSFFNAGVGGDKVSGGWAGPIDLRLRRDVFSRHPDQITIMLGMNDTYYRPDEPGIFSTYADGDRYIVTSIQKQLPDATITLIEPSPYDDITCQPEIPGGLNGALKKDGGFVGQLSLQDGTLLADFNGPVVQFLKLIHQENPVLAPEVIPGHVHPQQAGHWLMAEALLKAWHATSLVAAVSIDAADKQPAAKMENAEVSALSRGKDGRLTWTELDEALPLPFPAPELDPVLTYMLQRSDLLHALDEEMLEVRNLASGSYELRVDGRQVGTYSQADLAAGINLATADTPMLDQARLVAYDTERKNSLEAERFDIISHDLAGESSKTAALLAAAMPAAENRQRADAQPRPHRFEIVPVNRHP